MGICQLNKPYKGTIVKMIIEMIPAFKKLKGNKSFIGTIICNIKLWQNTLNILQWMIAKTENSYKFANSKHTSMATTKMYKSFICKYKVKCLKHQKMFLEFYI